MVKSGRKGIGGTVRPDPWNVGAKRELKGIQRVVRYVQRSLLVLVCALSGTRGERAETPGLYIERWCGCCYGLLNGNRTIT
jgi:hypothetical protein